MQGRISGPSSALERAQQQLQGKRLNTGYAKGEYKGKKQEDNDLDAYLSKLTHRVSLGASGRVTQRKEEPNSGITDVNPESYQDNLLASSTASRFIKKGHTLEGSRIQQRKPNVADMGSSIAKSIVAPGLLNRTTSVYTSSALKKVADIEERFAKPTQIEENFTVSSSSEMEFNVSASEEDSDYGGRPIRSKLEKWKTVGGRTKNQDGDTKRSASLNNLQRNDVAEDGKKLINSTKTPSYIWKNGANDGDVGQDGTKFLKKSTITAAAAVKNSSNDDNDSRFVEKPKKLDLTKIANNDRNLPSSGFSNLKSDFSTSKSKNESPPKGKVPVERTFRLDSEEDFEEFIMNLSPSSSLDIPPIRAQQKNEITKVDTPILGENSSIRRPATPAASKLSRARNSDSPPLGSAAAESSEDSITTESLKEDESFLKGLHANVMQLEDLEPVNAVCESGSPSMSKDSIMSELSQHRTADGSFLGALQTVDDLLQREEHIRPEKDDYRSDEDIKTSLIASDVMSEVIHTGESAAPSEVAYFEEDTFMSDSETESFQVKNTDQASTPAGCDVKPADASTSYQYSNDFASGHTDSDDVDELSPDITVTHSKSFTAYTESRTVIKSDRVKRSKAVKTCRDVGVQAHEVAPFSGHWLKDLDLSAMGTVTGVDPTPVALHVVNPQALEALTSYSPSILALNEALVSQIQHTRDSVRSSLHLHQSMLESIETDYNYTTVEETKEYIRQHRRPKLTMKEAMDQVKLEMEDGYR